MKVNACYQSFFYVMCVGLVILAIFQWRRISKNENEVEGFLDASSDREIVEGFLDHGIREDREKFRFHPYNIGWMQRAKAYDQMMLRRKAIEVELGSLCQPGFVSLQGRDPLKVDLWSYPELVFHPLDEREGVM